MNRSNWLTITVLGLVVLLVIGGIFPFWGLGHSFGYGWAAEVSSY